MKLKIIAPRERKSENIEQQDFLMQNGCSVIQGFYYSPASATENFTALLENQAPLFQATE